MTGAVRSFLIRELRVALFLSQNHVQVVVFLFSMFMLPGYYLLGELCHLTDADWSRDEEGKTQHRERQHTNASCSVGEHDL